MHDDQHGTAVVLLAALTNALTVVRQTAGTGSDRRQWTWRRGNGVLPNVVGRRRLASAGLRQRGHHPLRGSRATACLPNRSSCLFDAEIIRKERCVTPERRRCVHRSVGRQSAQCRRSGSDGSGPNCLCHGESGPGGLSRNWRFHTAASLRPDARIIRTRSTMRWHFPASSAARSTCRPARSTKR